MNPMITELVFAAALVGYVITSHVHTTKLIERFVMSVQDQIDTAVAQLAKAKDEIVAKLEAAKTDAEAEAVDVSALTAIAQDYTDLTAEPEADDHLEDDATDAAEETTAPAVELATESGDVLATITVDDTEAEKPNTDE